MGGGAGGCLHSDLQQVKARNDPSSGTLVARTGPKLNSNVSTYCSGGSTSLSPMYTILGEEIQGLIQENPGSCGTYEERNEQDSSRILGLIKIVPVCFPVCFFLLPTVYG